MFLDGMTKKKQHFISAAGGDTYQAHTVASENRNISDFDETYRYSLVTVSNMSVTLSDFVFYTFNQKKDTMDGFIQK